jgi:hypothetical protein
MELIYKHLNQETNPIMDKNLDGKIIWATDRHFVYHPKAKKCLSQLEWIFQEAKQAQQSEFPSDLEGLSIIGDSGSGKTMILEEFRKNHVQKHYKTYEGYPVAYAMLKDSITGLKGLYSALLSAFGHPLSNPDVFKVQKITVDQLEEILIHTLKSTQTRLFFIDEFQHAKGRNQQAILNQLKRTMLVSRVPFIPSGTPKTEIILNMDLQLADRCPVRDYSKLNYWKYGKDLRQFLAGYEQFLPFPEPSSLSSKDLSFLIFQKTKFSRGIHKGKTNLRHIARFLKRVSKNALRKSSRSITEEIIRDTIY